jgi:MFS family permease
VTLALMVGIYAVITATQYGWLSAHTLGFLGLMAIMLVVFLAIESRVKKPMVPLRILKLRTLMSTSVIRGFMATGMYATFFLGALDLEHVVHFDPLKTGLGFLPVTIMVAGLSTGLTAKMVSRFGPMRVLIPGLLSMTIGLLILATDGVHAGYWTNILPAFLLLGYGAGTAFVPLLTIGMEEVPKDDAGLGSGIVNVSQQMAAAVGLAILGTLATNKSNALIAAGHNVTSALSSGYRLAFLVGAGCVLVGLILAPILIRGSGNSTPMTDEERLEFEAHSVA